jgi:hypothetical protein
MTLNSTDLNARLSVMEDKNTAASEKLRTEFMQMFEMRD